MVWLLLIPCIAAIVFDAIYNLEGNGIVYGSLLSIVFICVFAGVMIGNGNGLAKWEAFYTANAENYEITVDETASYLSQEEFVNAIIQGSLEKWQQAGFVSERMKEWRDAVNKYNTTIASMKYFNRNIFTRTLVPDEVENMKLLIIK